MAKTAHGVTGVRRSAAVARRWLVVWWAAGSTERPEPRAASPGFATACTSTGWASCTGGQAPGLMQSDNVDLCRVVLGEWMSDESGAKLSESSLSAGELGRKRRVNERRESEMMFCCQIKFRWSVRAGREGPWNTEHRGRDAGCYRTWTGGLGDGVGNFKWDGALEARRLANVE